MSSLYILGIGLLQGMCNYFLPSSCFSGCFASFLAVLRTIFFLVSKLIAKETPVSDSALLLAPYEGATLVAQVFLFVCLFLPLELLFH